MMEHHNFEMDALRTVFYGICSECRKNESYKDNHMVACMRVPDKRMREKRKCRFGSRTGRKKAIAIPKEAILSISQPSISIVISGESIRRFLYLR